MRINRVFLLYSSLWYIIADTLSGYTALRDSQAPLSHA